MELLIILGALAVVILLAVGLFLFLQQRRSGTIRAVTRSRGSSGEPRNDQSGGTTQ